MANRNRRTTVDMSGVLKGLGQLIEAEEPIAHAMGVAMGVAVRDEAKIRAPVLKPENVGVDNQQPYLLRDSIYLGFDRRARVLNKTQYKYGVSWNAAKARHGHLLEFGHEMPYRYARTAAGLFFTPIPTTPTDGIFVAAQPFLGPAFDAKFSSLNGLATAAGAAKFRELFP